MKHSGIIILFLLGGIGVAFSSDSDLLQVYKNFATTAVDLLPSGHGNSLCHRESQMVRQQAKIGEFWALKLIDATAKVPSGLLNGNVNQFGDFDMCLSVSSGAVKGKYCLVEMAVTFKNSSFKDIEERMHGYSSMTSNITDLGQRLPKLGSWRWGVCVPASCSHADVENTFRTRLAAALEPIASIEVKVDPDLCYTQQKPTWSFGHYFTLFFIFTLLSFITMGTLLDQSSAASTSIAQFIFNVLPPQRANSCINLLLAFSFTTNWKKLTNTECPPDDVPIINGARALNAIGLLLSHKQMAYQFNPFINSSDLGEAIDGAWSMIGRTAILYTDSFIFLSGFLAAHSQVRALDRTGRLEVKKNLFARYLRFTPNLAIIILGCTYITELFSPGPQWGLVISKYSHLCKANMWRNFLYIHNYFGLEDMCLTHTHQVGIDMQLFLVSPLLVYMLWKSPRWGVPALVSIAGISTALRYNTALTHELSTVIYYGVPVDRLFRTARLSYILPTHRVTVYIMGILLGWGLRRGLDRLSISKETATVGWILAGISAMVAMFGPAHMSRKGYVYNSVEAALYNAWAPILWSAFLFWSAVAGWNKRGGWFYELLTWKYWAVFSRIAYALYLVQFPIFFYNVGQERSTQYYKGFFSIFDIKEFAAIFAASVLLTVCVDLPFQTLKRTFVGGKTVRTETDSDKPKTHINEVPHKTAELEAKRITGPG